jgi:signal peptidase II
VENEGIAFGMLQGFGALLAPVAVIIAFATWLYSYRNPKESSWTHLAMGLLSGGAIGNLIDRLALGKVTDMFSIRVFEFPVFNVADSCISIAGAILVLRWTFEIAHTKREEAEPAQAERPTPAGIGETVGTDAK